MANGATGVLPLQVLNRVIKSGFIKDVDGRYVNPASIDLPLSGEAYRLEFAFLPLVGERVHSIIERVGGTPHDLKNPLEVGVSYLIRVEGTITLPDNVYAYANPKSSTGRINFLARVVADGVGMYDALTPAGWAGEVWVLVRAESFPVLLTPGQAVCQIRLFDGKTFLSELELNLALQEHTLLYHPDKTRFIKDDRQRHADSLLLTILVEEGMVGWECRGSSRVLDFGKLDHYDPAEFFSKVEVHDKRLLLRKGGFYILSTYEHVVVPPHLSAELRAIDVRFGEFRSHSAGYIDPGWGWGRDGSTAGRPITLEITPHEDLSVANRQTIARIRYERMGEAPDVPYDLARSNYTGQNIGPALSKHFKKR